jgi:VWA domain containing CoxE-like protein
MLLALSLCLAAPISSGSNPHQDSPARTPGAQARILLTASDSKGNPVSAPTKESVQLHIGGQPVEIAEIRSLKDSPLVFSVLVDVSGSSEPFADQQVAATSKLFRDLAIGNNRGYLILFKSGLSTNDQVISAAAVEEVMNRFPRKTRSGGTALYDALVHAATEQLARTKIPSDSRRAIFVLSDFSDNGSRTSLTETLKFLQQQSTPVVAIGFSRSSGANSSREKSMELATWKSLFNGTGGWGTFLDEAGDGVGRAAALTNGQCLLLFRPPELKPEKSYRLKIESSAKGIRIIAPTEYVVP